ncbi:UDP-N-acetylmuramoyl-L-alanyl-D-glutamate--2,6-diaminopimelate ligase [Guyparkeria hydrothermalis]|uniref:UDP-N-acetylmuramoyl-L-alanyl-D-glutamate--2, 6-diaminopimelate ligase n=1 Tax=Guyparkeria TaxID=2035712 RepID=UPI0010ACC2A1|nr:MULTISPECIES: UDP-N-acetylmuramoyl-L-alanyl-D-glutamate--2,6-diaminopimelate ligase [Guyparkeria]MCL7750468.1 UDP-N-acetylmuramoyl-L-alanyl-D-glutamate--2,6-diaminopimelate ligase [Guyparkeria hydrothermalis]TKA90580.1 UDP-N-acetylmuramoyl-L-alanyl-D-glutamate--2,6-diaminopimelate ligase [Guyparkeria sp. SB14A]
MARVTFPEIGLREIAALRHAGAPDRQVRAISDDSRDLDAGTLFYARETQSHDADRFVADALARGAAGVIGAGLSPAEGVMLLDRPEEAIADLIIQANGWGHEAVSITAVTGTNGKTTVTHLIAGLIGLDGEPVGVIGTLGWGLWSPRVEYQSTTNTTPGLIENWRLIGELVREGAREIVMEVSSHALTQGRVEGLPIRTAVFTNLGRDHFDYHGDIEAYLGAKARLFALPSVRQAVLNADQSATRRMLETLAAQEDAPRTLCFSLGASAALADCQPCLNGRLEAPEAGRMRLSVSGPGERAELEAAMAGRFNAENLLAALAARLVVGETLDALARRVGRLKTPPGRMETFTVGCGMTAVVDYAHTSDALETVLASLRDGLPKGARLGVVFGCGGDRDAGKRPLMGEVAERLADWVIVTSDNPRSESPEAIIEAIVAGMRAPEAVERVVDRREAIAAGIRRLADGAPGDCLLVAGKGHETGQEIGDEVRPFDDRLVVREQAREVAA